MIKRVDETWFDIKPDVERHLKVVVMPLVRAVNMLIEEHNVLVSRMAPRAGDDPCEWELPGDQMAMFFEEKDPNATA